MIDNIFYSHAKETPNGRVGTKRLKVHIEGVSQKANDNFLQKINFGFHSTQLKDLLANVCKLHDLGKFTLYFQNYLLKKGKVDSELKKHSRIGAYVIFEKYKKKDDLILSVFAYFLIISHHSDLVNILEYGFKEENNSDKYRESFLAQKKSILNYIEEIKSEINFYDLPLLLNIPEFNVYRKEVRSIQKGKAKIDYYFLINYLFSLLIEADKLDASDTPVYLRRPIFNNYVDERLKKSNNELRNDVRKTVIQKLELPHILQQKIFTLTAPTGVGKTLTALDFALKLREKIYQAEKYLPQIIYALPFINIIEQGLDEYQKTMPGINILAHYQYADIFQSGTDKNNYSEDENERGYQQRLMQVDTWQTDVVITSFVQFFQTLIGNRNKILKKFNHLAGAIIILDEVQTLRLDQIPLIGASLYYLSKFLNTRILLMTATKPKIFELAYREILMDENNINSLDDEDKEFFNNGQPKYLELLHDNKNIYESYKRTKIVSRIATKLKDEQEFIEQIFDKEWSERYRPSCLIVVNKVSRSIALFEAIKSFLVENGFQNPIHYLSTNIVPCHRLNIIQKIKEELNPEDKKFPILISTQVVEAGVDLDFDMGFRDLAPIDSIVQVAGRINRQANPQKPEREHLPLFVIDFGDCEKIYGTITKVQSEKALGNKEEIFESDYLNLVESYFSELTAENKMSFDYSREIFEAMKTLKYDGDENSVSSFEIIKEQKNVCSVFVEVDDVATAAKEAFIAMISAAKEDANSLKQDFDKRFKKDFNQRVISVPNYYTKHLCPIFPTVENILVVTKEDLEKYYNIETGFIRDPKVQEIHTLML
jgi:CRISPR-associated endonuclease/helicase Cas3